MAMVPILDVETGELGAMMILAQMTRLDAAAQCSGEGSL